MNIFRSNISKWIVFVVLPLLFAGCGVVGLVDSYKAQNPDARTYVIDDDGDGVGDAVGLLDKNGQPEMGDNGEPSEVPGSRAQFDNAKATDNHIASLLGILAGVVPGAGYVGAKWGKAQPVARANALAVQLKTVVKSVDAVRHLEFSDPAILPAINQTLRDVQQTAAGVEAAVKAAKAEIIAENEAHAQQGAAA